MVFMKIKSKAVWDNAVDKEGVDINMQLKDMFMNYMKSVLQEFDKSKLKFQHTKSLSKFNVCIMLETKNFDFRFWYSRRYIYCHQ